MQLKNRLSRLIEQHWQNPNIFLSIILFLPSRLFIGIVAIRRWLYCQGWLKSIRLPIPVVVVGNIHVGGCGKTPVTIALVKGLQERGIKVGVVSRGYGRINQEMQIVTPQTSYQYGGDEPVLIARKTQVPVAVGQDRVQVAQLLLSQYPDLQIIICDDGLQHYRLQRDFELVVFPWQDIGRRLDVLPNGALREPLRRLQSVDMVCISGCDGLLETYNKTLRLSDKTVCYTVNIHTIRIYSLADPHTTVGTEVFANRQVIAVCGIARPERFFQLLEQLSIPVSKQLILSDHEKIPQRILDNNCQNIIIMTEKDSVKLPENNQYNHIFVIAIDMVFSPNLDWHIFEQLIK